MSAPSPNKFKYKFFHLGDWYYGNSVDEIAKNIGMPFAKAVPIVNKGIIAINRVALDQKIGTGNITKKVTLSEMVAGATSALKQIVGTHETQEVINRRAIICSACPKKAETSGCKSCGEGGRLVKFVNNVKKGFGGGVEIPNDLGKLFCSICDCSLAMMLPAKIEDFKESTINNKNRPAECWLKKEYEETNK